MNTALLDWAAFSPKLHQGQVFNSELPIVCPWSSLNYLYSLSIIRNQCIFYMNKNSSNIPFVLYQGCDQYLPYPCLIYQTMAMVTTGYTYIIFP